MAQGQRVLLVSAAVVAIAVAIVAATTSDATDAPGPSREPVAPRRVVQPRRSRRRVVETEPTVRSDAPPVVTADAPPSDPPDAAAIWDVVVLDDGGAPIEGVAVGFDRGSATIVTGADGVARHEAVTTGESKQFVVAGLADPLELSGPRTIVRLKDPLPLRAALVDAETGASLDGGAVTLSAGWRAARAQTVPMSSRDGAFEAGSAPVVRGECARFVFAIRPPAGYVTERDDGSVVVTGTACRWARRLDALLPLRSELPVRVCVRNGDGSPATGATVRGLEFTGRSRAFAAEPTGSDGETIVHGVPFLRGESVSVSAGLDAAGGARIASSATAAVTSAFGVILQVVLPDDAVAVDWGGSCCGGGSG